MYIWNVPAALNVGVGVLGVGGRRCLHLLQPVQTEQLEIRFADWAERV